MVWSCRVRGEIVYRVRGEIVYRVRGEIVYRVRGEIPRTQRYSLTGPLPFPLLTPIFR